MHDFTKNGRFSAQIDRRYEQAPISYRRISKKEERETGCFCRYQSRVYVITVE